MLRCVGSGRIPLCNLFRLCDGPDGRDHAQHRRADAVEEDLRVARVAVGVDPVAEHRVHEHIRNVADKRRDGNGRRGDVRRNAHFRLDGEICALAQEHGDADQQQQNHEQTAARAAGQDQEDADRHQAGKLAEQLLLGDRLERLVGQIAAERAADQAAAVSAERADGGRQRCGHAEHARAVRRQVAGNGGDGHIAPDQDGHDPHAGDLKGGHIVLEGDLFLIFFFFIAHAVSRVFRHQDRNQDAGHDGQTAHECQRALEAGDEVAAADDGHDADHDEAQQQGSQTVEGLEDAVHTALLFVGARHADALHDGRPESKAAGQAHEQPDDDGHGVALIREHEQEAQRCLTKDGDQQNRLRVELVSDPAAGQVGDGAADAVSGHQRAELGIRAAHGGNHLIVEAGLHVRHDVHKAVSDPECEQQQETLDIFRCVARV